MRDRYGTMCESSVRHKHTKETIRGKARTCAADNTCCCKRLYHDTSVVECQGFVMLPSCGAQRCEVVESARVRRVQRYGISVSRFKSMKCDVNAQKIALMCAVSTLYGHATATPIQKINQSNTSASEPCQADKHDAHSLDHQVRHTGTHERSD
jgi:hypothetical protein